MGISAVKEQHHLAVIASMRVESAVKDCSLGVRIAISEAKTIEEAQDFAAHYVRNRIASNASVEAYNAVMQI